MKRASGARTQGHCLRRTATRRLSHRRRDVKYHICASGGRREFAFGSFERRQLRLEHRRSLRVDVDGRERGWFGHGGGSRTQPATVTATNANMRRANLTLTRRPGTTTTFFTGAPFECFATGGRRSVLDRSCWQLPELSLPRSCLDLQHELLTSSCSSASGSWATLHRSSCPTRA